MYCPRCGSFNIKHFPNNRPVADFYCTECENEYELKSKTGSIDKKINDGAYSTMIERISCNKNPDFLFMRYSKEFQCVRDLVFIPKHFFTPDIIEKRKPLSENAHRAGWIGCNILIGKIPQQGRIHIIKNGKAQKNSLVVRQVAKSVKLKVDDINARGWIMDILNCLNNISSDVFSLSDIYYFIHYLSQKHPNNNNIQAKIRQQLQILRNLGFIEFLGKGVYAKIK